MADITLKHCEIVQIWPPPGAGPADVLLVYSVGGGAGDGRVDVTAATGELPAPISLPTGSHGSMLIPRVTALFAHYYRSDDGPPELPFTYVPVP
jgi:hypothetical protein